LPKEVGVLYLQQHGNQDKTLIRAGIERARGLIVAADDDKHNLFVVLGARQLAKRFNNPNLRIVARVIDEENTGKLLAAGADKALSPNFIGGFQMASHMITPELGAFWDHMLYGDEEMLRFSDVHLKDHPDLAGETVGDLKHRQNQVVVAIKRAGEYHYTPEPETRLEENDILIVLGTSAGVRKKEVELTTRY
jgi:voltage-gated potassium channel